MVMTVMAIMCIMPFITMLTPIIQDTIIADMVMMLLIVIFIRIMVADTKRNINMTRINMAVPVDILITHTVDHTVDTVDTAHTPYTADITVTITIMTMSNMRITTMVT